MVETTERPAPAEASGALSLGRRDWSTWPKYEAAVYGFRDYWYPVTWSKHVGRKPIQVTLCGEKIMLIRERGKVYALHDRCPHRGVPLSHPMGSQEFPGTWTCCYHGWTFDLETGRLVAAITDGPESPICGKVAVRTYPVERYVLPREERTVATAYGPVRVKLVTLPDGARRAAPEYEDCRRVARERGVPVAEVYAAAQRAALDHPAG